MKTGSIINYNTFPKNESKFSTVKNIFSLSLIIVSSTYINKIELLPSAMNNRVEKVISYNKYESNVSMGFDGEGFIMNNPVTEGRFTQFEKRIETSISNIEKIMDEQSKDLKLIIGRLDTFVDKPRVVEIIEQDNNEKTALKIKGIKNVTSNIIVAIISAIITAIVTVLITVSLT